MRATAQVGEIPLLIECYLTVFEILQQLQLVLIPFLLEKVGGDPALNLPDGIHPNVEGQKIVAQTVWKTLYPVISR